MKLIKNLDMRKTETAKRPFRWGLFYCPFCRKEVEKVLSNGILAKSCGCQRYSHVIKHGLCIINNKMNPLYLMWSEMKRRCLNKNSKSYKYYGKRGIGICDEWINNIEVFHEWALKNGWEKGLEIDRKNNDGNYEPNNCRFIPHVENSQNSRQTKLTAKQVRKIRIEHKIMGISFKGLGIKYSVDANTINSIVKRKTWNNIL